jgi:ubiquinone/menaquinone biosynthesis C-methylase UbiE
MAKYDIIGYDYDYRRTADPYLAGRIVDLIGPLQVGTYLDIGCGTGNYTTYLAEQGMELIGIDPSERMLSEAKRRTPGVDWRIGEAANTGLKDSSVEGIIAVLTIHHWPDISAGFKELSRVLKLGRKMVLFTSDRKQMKAYWLNHYFPSMLTDSFNQMPSKDELAQAANSSGLSVSAEELYFVKDDLQDHFLYVGKHDPKLYLDEGIRKGISSFSHLANQKEVTNGLDELKEDIETGKVEEVMAAYDKTHGDYYFMVLQKSA